MARLRLCFLQPTLRLIFHGMFVNVRDLSDDNTTGFTVVSISVRFSTLLSVLTRQPLWAVLLVIFVIAFAVLLFYLANRAMNPSAKNAIMITAVCSTGHIIALGLFLQWLGGLSDAFPHVRIYFWLSLGSLLLTIVLNIITNGVLFSRAMQQPNFVEHVRRHPIVTTFVLCFSSLNCALMGLLNSGLFGSWMLSAPISDDLDQQFALAGLVSNVFKDLPQLILQASVLFELQTLNDGLVVICFSSASLAFGLSKRAYIVVNRNSKKPELDGIELGSS